MSDGPTKEDLDLALDTLNKFKNLYVNSQRLICLLVDEAGGEFRSPIGAAAPDIQKLRIYQDHSSLEVVITTRPDPIESKKEPY